MSDAPIGFFDSGLGGLSIWKETIIRLPQENTIYLADSKNAPYGTKSHEQIIALSVKNTERLLALNCKMIVVACNTATTNAISFLRENYSIPFIGVEPAIKPAALFTKTRRIGILATKGTLASALFHDTRELHTDGVKVIEVQGVGLVELIEANKIYTVEMKQLLASYLDPMITAGVDAIVLGCSHYPFLIPVMKDLLPDHVRIIDSGAAVARQTERIAIQHGINAIHSHIGMHKVYTNLNVEIAASFINDQRNVTCEYLDF